MTDPAQEKFVTVYKAPNEFMAKTIESLLEQNGIQVLTRSFQVPHLDSIVTYIKGDWGEILVREDQKAEALDYIDGFLSQSDE
jgi:arsenate reductase-like glutaredoxin family protein